jgi:gliding motility-associated-like protein
MNFIRMKQLLLSIFLFSGYHSFSQVTCTVSPADTTVCFRDSITLRTDTTGSGIFTYKWLKNNVIISDADTSFLTIPVVDYPDTGVYICIVSNGIFTDTSNTARLRMHPKMKIDTLYRYNDLGCPGTCKGQFKVKVSGGAPPYNYEWGSGFSQDTIVFGLCQGNYTFIVTDTNQCSLDSTYYVDVLKTPEIEISVEPGDTIYLTKPAIVVSFPDTSEMKITNWEWKFGDTTALFPNNNPASYIFSNDSSSLGLQTIKLFFTDLNGCVDSSFHDITVKIAKLKIPNVFTPDNNDINETFVIKLEDSDLNFSDVYMSTELQIIDRWGRKVYSKSNYKSGEWDGKNLSDGAYFYILQCTGFYGVDVFKGSVTILRQH